MQRYDLREIPFFYINLNDAKERNEKMIKILGDLGIKNFKKINATKHKVGQAGTARSMLEALEIAINPIVSPLGTPFVILKDGIQLLRCQRMLMLYTLASLVGVG
jgi:hypothetical protein